MKDLLKVNFFLVRLVKTLSFEDDSLQIFIKTFKSQRKNTNSENNISLLIITQFDSLIDLYKSQHLQKSRLRYKLSFQHDFHTFAISTPNLKPDWI